LSDNFPTIGVAIAIPNVYSVIPHVPAVAVTSKDEFIVVNAALIIPLSRAAINTPTNNMTKPILIFESFSCCDKFNISRYNSRYLHLYIYPSDEGETKYWNIIRP